MYSLANLHLQSNTKINFTGGNLSSDAGLLLLHKFIDKIGLRSLLRNGFKTTDKAKSDQDTVAVGEGDGVTVEITYKKPVWTQVTADGKGIEAATIPAGTTKVFKGNKEVKVNLGSIRDVTIKVNGKEVPYGEKEWGTVNKVFKK